MTSDFAALERQLKRAIKVAHEAGVKSMGERAKELCPKDTGETAEKIKVDAEKGTISQDWYIGIFQELGTKDMPAHPYLRPAFDHGVRPMIRDIKAAINKELGE